MTDEAPQPTWIQYPDDFNTLYVVADQRTFKFAETEIDIDTSLGVKWDVKESAGTDGANEKYRGYSPAKVSVTWLLYTLEHEFEWTRLFNDIAPKPGKTAPGPILVLHPLIAKVNLGRFRIDDISGPKKKTIGMLSVTLKLFEYFDAPKVTPKTTAAGASPITSIPIAKELTPRVPPPPALPSTGAGTKP